jgi:hypothetical protein
MLGGELLSLGAYRSDLWGCGSFLEQDEQSARTVAIDAT